LTKVFALKQPPVKRVIPLPALSLECKIYKPFLLALSLMMDEAFPKNPYQLTLPSRF